MEGRGDSAGVEGRPPPGGSKRRWLLCPEGNRYLALPAAHVVETMRPLPVEPVPNVPAFVTGVAVVRGAPVPVVDAGLVLGGRGGTARRWVTLSVGARSVVLAVESVEAFCELEESGFDVVPPLLRGVAEEVVTAIGTLDARLLLVLEAGRLLTEAQWRALSPLAGES